MNTLLKITALAVAAMIALASGAQAASLYDDDDDKGSSYDRQSQSSYCYKHPYDEACDPNARQRHYRDNGDGDDRSYTAGRCAALVRAVGKRNLVLAFARNSARFSWAREARFVHGDQYANWYNARNAHISCTRVGGLSSCEATATPCR
jgi:hypothetical protein